MRVYMYDDEMIWLKRISWVGGGVNRQMQKTQQGNLLEIGKHPKHIAF